MMRFKSFINEAAVSYARASFAEITAAVETAHQNKFIINPEYNAIKTRFNRLLENLFTVDVAAPFLHGRGQENSQLKDRALADLTQEYIYSPRELKSVKKKLAKVTDTGHPVFRAYHSFVMKYEDICQKVEDLKQYVKKVSDIRAERKAVEKTKQARIFMDSSSLVKVLESHMEMFVKRARDFGENIYAQRKSFLDKNGGIDKVAPEPSSRLGREAYQEAKQKRGMYLVITQKTKDEFGKIYADSARADYMAWVHKMTQKIGAKVIDASMSGSPWVGSTITVTLEGGISQTWVTKMIINQSKYGKPFNQFPTRKK